MKPANITNTVTESPIEAYREGIAKARAEVMRRAEARGVKPFNSLEDHEGNPEIAADFDVDEFLRQVHEDRNRT